MDQTTIITHDGKFHADEVFAFATLALLTGSTPILIRTRDAAHYQMEDVILLDCGEESNGPRGRFDHHQKGRAGARTNGVLYSTFGLVWSYYRIPLAQKGVTGRVWSYVDRVLVQPIDAQDNGQVTLFPMDGHYPFPTPSWSDLITQYNPHWHEPPTEVTRHRAFLSAAQFAGGILQRTIQEAQADEMAYDIVWTAVTEASDPRIITLPVSCPWQETLIGASKEALFVVFQGTNGDWLVQCVPEAPKSYQSRAPLPREWAGLRGEELEKEAGVRGATFCHANAYIAGAKTKEGAYMLAVRALERFPFSRARYP